uniref:Serine protease inhibitor swm-1-like n=1 Tax=Xenopus tropicalis TaxID=8364 RepID=A0A803JTT6_XENTR
MGICNRYSSLGLLAMALIFVALNQSEAATTKDPCPANMFYRCKRTCYNNCDNLNSTSDAGCTRVCRLGCDCKQGYVFKSKDSNTCVPVSACNVSCPEHSAFIPCYRQKFTMATWQNYSFLLAMALVFMANVQSQDAPPQGRCPADMVYGCKRVCFSNCDNLNSTRDVCILMCPIGCDCKEGFVFKSKDSNTCVPVSACKVSCPQHSTFIPCYTHSRKSCRTKDDPETSSGTCSPRCVCDKGYILSDEPDPRCIKISECPKITN